MGARCMGAEAFELVCFPEAVKSLNFHDRSSNTYIMRYFIIVIIGMLSAAVTFAKDIRLLSPDRNTEVVLRDGKSLAFEVIFRSKPLFKVENISLDIDGKAFAPKVTGSTRNTVDEVIRPVIREKYSVIHDRYNELTVNLKGGYSLIVRAYDNGIAYRFRTNFRDSITVGAEGMDIILGDGDTLYFQHSKTFRSSYETPYEKKAISGITTAGYLCLPALVRKPDDTNILITESDLFDFPGLWLKGTGRAALTTAHAPYPKELTEEGSPYGRGQVKNHEKFIARTAGRRDFPWRVFIVSADDAGLLTNALVYQLAGPSQIADPSWIRPGVVTFDWWGRRGIYGVDFKAGVNTATAKYFIDFAAEFGFEYFLFDDGWCARDDLFAIAPGLDMDAVMAYAKEKDVKIMLWAIWRTFEKQKEKAWEQFEKWGISGIKFDFMNRDDQQMVRFYREVAEEAAKRKMVIDFHGAYKPAGLRRAYPNVLTREALIEFEYNGWTKHVTPRHDNLLPYLRMVTGPMDYIPYTTRNATKKNFRPVGDMPMGQGTRAHSMAQFVIYESPMQMLPDGPSDYYRERECTEFISKIPVEWDDLKVLRAKLGEYTVLARKNGDNWYIGAITDWQERSFDIRFDFVGEGKYTMEYIEDGINAGTRAIDYKKKSRTITAGDMMKINLASGGGWVAILQKVD